MLFWWCWYIVNSVELIKKKNTYILHQLFDRIFTLVYEVPFMLVVSPKLDPAVTLTCRQREMHVRFFVKETKGKLYFGLNDNGIKMGLA